MSNPPKDTSQKPSEEHAPPAERERLLARALADYLDSQAREETADIEGFCRQHPELEPDLRIALETLADFDRASEPAPPPLPSVPPEEIPQRLSGHRILKEIGRGGMGSVYLALDERLGRLVAIKALNRRYRDNRALCTRFMQEARAMARLSHPHIVHIYNLGQPAEPPHFVMEYLEGIPLTEAAGPLSLSQKVALMRKVALAVEHLHQHQIVHRDLKPGNILVGHNLEPKILDFGLALQVDDLDARLTRAGDVMGTPDYFSPEQARAQETLDARSDIFSLGTILYELLTGTVPFRGETFPELAHNICHQDPLLPRRLDPTLPGDLQNICLKALEKNPANRYHSAREMAADLERYLAAEPVLAVPSAYGRLIEGKIEQHLRELEGWWQDQVISDYEHDALRKAYDRLVEREDAWILQVRRLYPSQVALYLGAWVLVVGAALIFLFHYPALSGTQSLLLVAAATALAGSLGIRLWKATRLRIAVAYLLASCLLLPLALLVGMQAYGFFTSFTQGREGLELFLRLGVAKKITNAQLWWAILLSLPAYAWLRRFTRSSVFSLVFAVMGMIFSLLTLLRLGLLDWLETDPGKVYFHLMPYAVLFFLVAFLLEHRRQPNDSRYFYPIAVLFTLVSLSGVAAFHEPYRTWLEATAPWTRGQVEYFFIGNAAIYYSLHRLCESFRSAQMRTVAKSFRFVIPGHVMTSLLLLGLEATRLWEESPDNLALRREARIFEFLLPAVACLFVFGSIPRQMKNFLVTGLLFLAVGIIRLQQQYLKDRASWPVLLLALGLLLMLLAANYSTLRAHLTRRVSRKS